MNKDTGFMISRLQAAGVSYDDALKMRRISMTLHRWHELECGLDNGCIERDEDDTYICTQCGHKGYGSGNCDKCGDCAPIHHKATGKPFWLDSLTMRRYATADREKGALKRLAVIMARYPELSAYVQGDPRGASLYILRAGDIPEGCEVGAYYNRGIAVYK